MRRLYIVIFCVLGLLVVLYPAIADGGNDIGGTWSFDVAATVALMRESGGLPAPLAEVEARLARTRVTIDTMRKVFTVTEAGTEREHDVITMVSVRDGAITVHRKRKAGSRFRFLDDGRLAGLENDRPVFVLRRVE